jgi:mRNA-degrading endonuclease toxin of MazEF toxin-antitoxin module
MAYASPVSRGEVWWAGLDGRRLVLVLSKTDDDVRAVMIVPPAERLIDGITEEVRLGAEDGLPDAGVVRVVFPGENFIPCNWLVTLPLHDMMERAGELAADKLAEVDSLLRRAGLDIDLA